MWCYNLVTMHWSKWPYWLRGGVSMSLLYLPLLLILFLGPDSAFILWPLSIPMWPILWLVGLPYTIFDININLPVFVQHIIVFILAVSLGTIIGLVYGKRKRARGETSSMVNSIQWGTSKVQLRDRIEWVNCSILDRRREQSRWCLPKQQCSSTAPNWSRLQLGSWNLAVQQVSTL